MNRVLIGENFSDPEEFAKQLNSARLANKNNWFVFSGQVGGKLVELKMFGLYLQIFRIDGVNHGGQEFSKVNLFREFVSSAIKV
jgi:hypothetical protein